MGAVLPGEEQQGLYDGADAVVRYGERMPGVRGSGPVDQRPQGLVEVEVRALDPVGQLLVGEPVSGPGRHEQPLGEHGGRPPAATAEPRRCGTPREHRLERLPVQLPLPRAETPPRRFVHLPGHLGGEPSYGGAAQPVLGGEPDRDPQAHEVEVGGEHVVPVERGARCGGQRGEHLGEESQGEGMPGIGFGKDTVRNAVGCAGSAGFVRAEVSKVNAYRRNRPGDCAPRPPSA